MIEITIDKQEFSIPSSYEDVTVRQYNEMVTHADNLNAVRIMSIFTGIDYDTLNNFDCTGFIENVLPLLNFLQQPLMLMDLPRRETISIRSKYAGMMTLPVIKNPGRERIGQKLNMTSLIGKVEGNTKLIPSIMAQVVATYYAPYMREDKLWKEDHVAEVAEAAWDMKIVEAAPECAFFLRGYIAHLKKNPNLLQ